MSAPLLRSIEPLEARIAPATVLDLQVNITGTRAIWTDIDGDKVSLTSNKGVLHPSDFTFLEQQEGDLGYQLSLLNLSNEHTSGFTLTFSARRDAVNKVGDGSVNVGWINALYSDITTITIPGDLARLDVGDANFATPALGMLTVYSAGMLGPFSQGSNPGGVDPTVDWEIYGRLGGLSVKGDFSVNLKVFGTSNNPLLGSTGPLTIGGDIYTSNPALTSSTTTSGGFLYSSGPMGAVKIKGDVFGGSSPLSGSITSDASIASVAIGGSLYGGSGDYSGAIYAGGILGPVTIGASLSSGVAHDESGTAVPAYAAGSISSKVKVTSVAITGDAVGGDSIFGGSIFTSPGYFGKIGTVTIKGSMSGSTQLAGSGETAEIIFNGIYSDSTIGAVKVGSLSGNSTNSPVNIVALGKINPVAAKDSLAIASVTVARGSYAAQILAGYDKNLVAVNPDVQIGPVVVANNWIAGSIAAGIDFGGNYSGDADDKVVIPPAGVSNKPSIPSRIQSVTVGGYIYGTFQSADSFSFQAQQIGSVKVGGALLELKPATQEDFLLAVTHDFRVREL